jgi:plastocyanin
VVSLALLGTSAPFLVDALAHPESIADFLPLSAFTLATLIGVVAAIPSFRQGRDPDSPSSSAKRVGVAATGLFAAAVVVSVVAFTGIESVPARADDIQIVTSDLRFEPAAIEADGGTISVHVTNRDSTRHTFTVDELGVDLSIPPDSAQRVTFMAEAGTYRFYCRPHAPGMEGRLIVA